MCSQILKALSCGEPPYVCLFLFFAHPKDEQHFQKFDEHFYYLLSEFALKLIGF